MTGEVDYGRYTEAELLEVLRRIDPRRSGQNFHRLTAALEGRGYIVTVTEYGSARAVLREDAPRRSLDATVRFGAGGGPLTWMEPSRNDFRLVGSGCVQVDNATVQITGRRLGLLAGPFFTHTICLDRERIINAETDANAVRFEYRENASTIRAMTLWLDNSSTAERLIQLLPTQRDPEFRGQLADAIRFEDQLRSRSPRAPVTTALVAANLLVFAAMWAAGAELFAPAGTIHIAWGSNFGPYTTDGEWWRLFTSAFLHFGIVHLAFNMWALAAVGPLVERLYGSAAYLFIYAIACLAASLASTGWHPDVNSAGASGAIFGVYGALLAAMLRGRRTIPRGVVAPLRTSALVFTLYALAIGFLSKEVDNGAHLGGLAAGFLVGVVYPRAAIAQKTAYGPKVIAAAVATGSLVVAAGMRIPRDREQGFHGMVNTDSTAT